MGVALEPLCSNLIIDADRIEVAIDDCCARQLVPPNRWRQTSARSSRMDGVSFGPSELTMRSTALHDSVASTVRSRRNRVEVSIVEMVRSKNRCSDSLGRGTIGETTHAGRCARPADDRHVTMTIGIGAALLRTPATPPQHAGPHWAVRRKDASDCHRSSRLNRPSSVRYSIDKARWTPDVVERRQGPLPLMAKPRATR